MHSLIDEIAAAAARDRMFDGVSRLLVGCSGGADSTALLDILSRLAPALDLHIGVVHLHHGWRGLEADADQDLVENLARRRGLEFFADRVDLREVAGSREEAARNARLAFFGSVAREWPANAVALGHTADDQLETVILNLARGTGRRGLGGMRRRADVGELRILRPLLDVRRSDVRGYARTAGLTWSEDASNTDISLARNRLRHRLLGELQQVNPGVVDNVARAAGLLREEDEWIETIAKATLEGLMLADEYRGAISVDSERLAALPRPLRRRVARLAIGAVRGDCRGISHEHVEWIVNCTDGGQPSARDLPGVRVRREETRIRLLPLVDRRLARPRSG